jgi:hypothetical protein
MWPMADITSGVIFGSLQYAVAGDEETNAVIRLMNHQHLRFLFRSLPYPGTALPVRPSVPLRPQGQVPLFV